MCRMFFRFVLCAGGLLASWSLVRGIGQRKPLTSSHRIFRLTAIIRRSKSASPSADAVKTQPTIRRVLDFKLPADVEYFKSVADGRHPVVIRNAFKVDGDKWTEQLVQRNADAVIEYDVRTSSTGLIESYECSLGEFLGALEDSAHAESSYLMNEDLLNTLPNQPLLDRLALNASIFGQDLFQFFPFSIRPKLALIIGGAGARSFLHGDPYEWTGWNYLFEGEKLWTFIPPEIPDELFGARRNAPDAWGSEHSISAGWVSDDVDLYRTIIPSGAAPTAGLAKHFLGVAPVCSGSPPPLPTFASGDAAVDACETSLIQGALQIVQREGDLVLIPPRWWHQVYHISPSIAVASQYVNDKVRNGMYRHVARWCGVDEQSLLGKEFFAQSAELQVQELILSALCAKNGEDKGQQLFDALFAEEDSSEEP